MPDFFISYAREDGRFVASGRLVRSITGRALTPQMESLAATSVTQGFTPTERTRYLKR